MTRITHMVEIDVSDPDDAEMISTFLDALDADLKSIKSDRYYINSSYNPNL